MAILITRKVLHQVFVGHLLLQGGHHFLVAFFLPGQAAMHLDQHVHQGPNVVDPTLLSSHVDVWRAIAVSTSKVALRSCPSHHPLVIHHLCKLTKYTFIICNYTSKNKEPTGPFQNLKCAQHVFYQHPTHVPLQNLPA